MVMFTQDLEAIRPECCLHSCSLMCVREEAKATCTLDGASCTAFLRMSTHAACHVSLTWCVTWCVYVQI